MDNMLTDQLLLAQKKYASGFLFFQHRLQPLFDCHQVVFQGDRLQGIVSPDTIREQQIKVRKDDVIIRVFSEPRVYLLTGTLSTKDKYKRVYEIPLELTVSDLALFAENYFQKKDPAKQAIDLFKANFEHYATGIEYMRVQSLNISFAHWNVKWQETGVHLEQADKTMFREDPQYTDPNVERAKLQEQTQKQIEALEANKSVQFAQDKIQRAREQAQKEFDHQEKTKDQLYTICYNLRQVTAEEITAVLKERIHEGFESGRTPSQISGEYFALVSMFEDRTHIEVEKSIIAGMFVEGSLQDGDGDLDQESSDTEAAEEPIQHSNV
jgi:hypothetical protein